MKCAKSPVLHRQPMCGVLKFVDERLQLLRVVPGHLNDVRFLLFPPGEAEPSSKEKGDGLFGALLRQNEISIPTSQLIEFHMADRYR